MNFKQLHSFSRIVELGSQARAAKSMNISESALSRQISLLEEELGKKLFSRNRAQLVPTAFAETFLSEVDRVLTAFEQLPQIARDIADGSRQRLRIVAIHRLAGAVASPAIARLQQAHPQLDVTIDIEPYRNIERWLRGKQYDLAIGPAVADFQDLIGRVFISAPIVAVVPRTHKLARNKMVKISELKGERVVLTAPGSQMREKIEKLFVSAGETLNSTLDVSDTFLACQFAAENHAIAISDPFSPAPVIAQVSIIPISPRLNIEFALIKHDHPATDLLAEFELILQETAAAYLAQVIPR